MKVDRQAAFNNINNTPSFHGRAVLGKKFARYMSKFDHFGEGTNITLDFVGKAVITPLVIIAAANESKEKKEYSAIKNPIAAFIQLALEVPILYWGTKFIGNLANQGKLDKQDSPFSYNEKAAKESFIKKFRSTPDTGGLIEKINKKGLTKRFADELGEIVDKTDSSLLKQSFENYKSTSKRLYHMQNRLCFAATLILTPALCALENWAHPKVMDKFFPQKKGIRNAPCHSHSMYPNFQAFNKILNPPIKQGGQK